jgi:aminoglycoside phosphotransferase (APT) family kinase protein
VGPSDERVGPSDERVGPTDGGGGPGDERVGSGDGGGGPGDERIDPDDERVGMDDATIGDSDLGETFESSPVDEATVRGMVRACRPDWTALEATLAEQGTDFVCFLTCETPAGTREAVLKATTADFVPPEIARSEPRLFELVGRETDIPVPAVYGARDDHPDYPAPFYLVERLPGENAAGRFDDLSPDSRDRVVETAGRHLAALHDLGPLPAYGRVGVRDGELAVLDTDDHPRYDDFRATVLDGAEETLDALTDGGFFPELADDPERFVGLVPDLRAYLRETVPDLPVPDPPTYCHWDYRYGNLLVDPDVGETLAVLDWANLSAAEPAYNLATVESHLVADDDPTERAADLRERFEAAYAEARDGWSFDEAVRERMGVYRLTSRLDAMACLPLWHQDGTPEDRDERERQHREAVAEYL